MKKKLNPFYEKMLKAKEAKKAVSKKDKQKKQEKFMEPPKEKGDKLASVPKAKQRIEVTAPTPVTKQNGSNAVEVAINRIREQAQNL